jgi:hypothetical protein
VVAFYNGRGTAEQHIKEGKDAVKWTRLSCLEVQTKYARSIMQDYLSEANKIADLSTRSLLDSFSTLQQARDKQTRDITPHGEAAA